MRQPPRLFSSLHGHFVLLLVVGFVFPLSAQSPGPKPDLLREKWNEAVTMLAEKIAAAVDPARRISLEVKNLSSLEGNEVSAIQRELRSDLEQRHLRIAPATASDAQVRVTICEGTTGRVLAAEVRRGNERQVALLPAPVEPVAVDAARSEALTLTAKLVWKQRKPFLDFALFERLAGIDSRLLIVEAGRLAYYELTNGQWQPLQVVWVPGSKPSFRHMQARIELSQNNILFSDAKCTGNLVVPSEVLCAAREGVSSWGPSAYVPGHEGSLATGLSQKCSGSQVVLVSGNGDWTEPDTLQGFEEIQIKAPPVPTGNILNFDGPILALDENGPGVVARTVIHNLKTGDYEAYLVTATCSH